MRPSQSHRSRHCGSLPVANGAPNNLFGRAVAGVQVVWTSVITRPKCDALRHEGRSFCIIGPPYQAKLRQFQDREFFWMGDRHRSRTEMTDNHVIFRCRHDNTSQRVTRHSHCDTDSVGCFLSNSVRKDSPLTLSLGGAQTRPLKGVLCDTENTQATC